MSKLVDVDSFLWFRLEKLIKNLIKNFGKVINKHNLSVSLHLYLVVMGNGFFLIRLRKRVSR